MNDDNAYPESLFRTAKYPAEFPTKGFVHLAAAQDWATNLVRWYNVAHRHSGIRYVSPAARHAGDDHANLAARHERYGAVALNPERDSVVAMATAA